jgi:hypothetical protein
MQEREDVVKDGRKRKPYFTNKPYEFGIFFVRLKCKKCKQINLQTELKSAKNTFKLFTEHQLTRNKH